MNVFLQVEILIGIALLSYLASANYIGIKKSKIKTTKGYFVVFLIHKDHDFRNIGVPMQERLKSGRELVLSGRCVAHSDLGSSQPGVFVPSRLRKWLFDMVNDGEVTGIDIAQIIPMNAADVSAEQECVAEMMAMMQQHLAGFKPETDVRK